MICPNCGRRNTAGATFCSRCHQRLPLASKIDTNRRRTVVVEPRGGGGSAAVVLAVALLAGFLFIAGAAAIYLSNPPGTADPTDIAVASGSPTLPPFVQPTATPSPSPTFILLPSESPSFSPLPTGTLVIGPTSPPTPVGPTQPPTNTVVAKFTCTQQGTSRTINCQDNSTGPVESREWNFGDGSPTESGTNPSHTYDTYGTKQVTLTVTGPDGTTSFKPKQITLQPPATPTPTAPPTPIATPTPAPTPTPTPTPTQTVVVASASPESTGSSAP